MKTKQSKPRYRTDRRPKLPSKFVPRVFDEADGRYALVKEIRRRVEELKADTGADSVQKDILCQRAIFLALQLETMEVHVAEGRTIEMGSYTQAVNALSGLLKKLGLERHSKKVDNLTEYIEKQQGKHEYRHKKKRKRSA